MHLRVLMDNIEWNELIGEWGLSLLIDFGGHSILLDAGATVNFSHILAPQPAGVKKVSVHLAELEMPDGGKK